MRYAGFEKVFIFGKSPHPGANLPQGQKGEAAEQTLAQICRNGKKIDPVSNLTQGQGEAREQAGAMFPLGQICPNGKKARDII